VNGVGIRSGAYADIDAVLRLWRAAEANPSATDSLEDLKRLLDSDADALVLADADSEIVGSLIVAWNGWRGSFYRLAVHPAHRRRGIGAAL